MLGLMQGQQLLISNLIEFAERNHPDAEIVSRRVEGDIHRYTYADLAPRARKVARALDALGLQFSDRVGTLAWNGYRHMELYFGVSGSGRVLHTLNPRLHPDQVVWIANHAEDQVMCFDMTFLPLIQAVHARCTTIKHWVALCDADKLPAGTGIPGLVSYETLIDQQRADYEWPSFDENTASSLCYTSGTTGLPKGCMHTHSSIMHNAVASSMWGNASHETVALLVVPMFHITGMVSLMHSSIYSGATLVMMPRWDRDLAGRLISTWRVTSWTNIPTMVIDLLASPNFAQYDLTSLVHIGGGGAAMPQAVAQRLLDAYGLKYVEGYGLTETAAPSHSNPPDAPKQQCLGIPFMSTDARVVNPDTLEEVAQGEQGEIVMHGPEIFLGYWKRPDATAAAFFELEGKRFFRSGDLGRVDEDGYFFITDRLKRMINASGFKVWPAEVEALMFRHPAIADACVISTRDAYRGESVKAVIVLRSTHKATTADEIIAWCRENMAVYKAPKFVQFVDALPKSGSGKVMWRALQDAEPKV